MYTNFLFISFVISTIYLNGQNLTIDQVISLRNKTVVEVEEFLISKNWELTGVTIPIDSTITSGVLSFAYNKNPISDRAECFISYYYLNPIIDNNKRGNQISIQLHNKTVYNKFISRLNEIGFKFKYSKVKEGEIIKIYKNDSLTVEVKNKTFKEEFTTINQYIFDISNSWIYYWANER